MIEYDAEDNALAPMPNLYSRKYAKEYEEYRAVQRAYNFHPLDYDTWLDWFVANNYRPISI